MTPAECAQAVFTAVTLGRLAGYVPQMVRLVGDMTGARAVSVSTWIVFTLSNVATVAYAALTVGDATMAGAFAANTAFCAGIVLLTWRARLRHRRLAARVGAHAFGGRGRPEPKSTSLPPYRADGPRAAPATGPAEPCPDESHPDRPSTRPGSRRRRPYVPSPCSAPCRTVPSPGRGRRRSGRRRNCARPPPPGSRSRSATPDRE